MTQESIQELIRKQREYFYTGATLDVNFRRKPVCNYEYGSAFHNRIFMFRI